MKERYNKHFYFHAADDEDIVQSMSGLRAVEAGARTRLQTLALSGANGNP